MHNKSLEEVYVLAILTGVIRAELHKLEKQGIRAGARDQVDPVKVKRTFQQLLRTIEDHIIPF